MMNLGMFSGRVVLYLAALCLAPAPAAPAMQKAAADPAATRALHALFDAEWERAMRENPLRASFLGDRRYNDRWPQMSLAALEQQNLRDRMALDQLQRIPREQLSTADQLNYDLFAYIYRNQVEGHQHQWHLVRTNTFSGIQSIERVVNSLRFETVKDYEDWLARIRAFPAFMDQNIELMRAGMERRIVLARIISERILAQMEKVAWDDPTQHGFYRPFTRFAASIPEAERRRLSSAARSAIAEHALPAFRRLQQFVAEEYLPASFDAPGAWQAPGGQQKYAYLARSFTTTRLTPEEIHQIGLAEVERIRARQLELMKEAGFEGTVREFFDHLHQDPRFLLKTEDELLTHVRALAKKIDPLLVKVMKTMPRMPYGVEPIPASIAPDQPSGYASAPAADGSRPGMFYVNTYKPETRPTWELVSLTLHEAAPGHAFQGALAVELEDLPKFRRHAGYSAYSEGWALYSETLGYELGVYEDLYTRFGQLSDEIWRAVRLVVDTGMHSMQWSRQQALDYMLEHVATSEHNAVTEIDRYISWPGQALAYKIGELKIQELRRRAQKELGPEFRLGEFHDVLLLNGPLPLELLEQRVEEWIAGHRVADAD